MDQRYVSKANLKLLTRNYNISGFVFQVIKRNSSKVYTLNVEKMRNCSANLNYLEHVVSVVTLLGGVRGKLEVFLVAPSRTRSTLLEPRRLDLSREGFLSWPFMSVHFWGEKPDGEWRLQVVNNGDEPVWLAEWHLKLFGVKNLP
jgi:furin